MAAELLMTDEEIIYKLSTLDEDGKKRVLRTLEWEYEDTIAGRLEALRSGEKTAKGGTRKNKTRRF